MKQDFLKKLSLVASIVASGLVPAAIFGVSFGINYIFTALALSNDLASYVIVYIGGISSVLFYSYLVYSDIRTFIKEQDGEYALRSMEIDQEIEQRKCEFHNIIEASKNLETGGQSPNEIKLKFVAMNPNNMDSEYILRTIVNASRLVATARKVDLSSLEIDENALTQAVVSANLEIERFSKYHGTEFVSGHRKAAIYSYWVAKLKPLRAIGDMEEVNEIVAIKLGMQIIGKTEEALKDHRFYENLIYHLRYRNVDSDCLALIYQGLLGEGDNIDQA